jgi:hypothetical protein
MIETEEEMGAMLIVRFLFARANLTTRFATRFVCHLCYTSLGIFKGVSSIRSHDDDDDDDDDSVHMGCVNRFGG